MLSKAQIKYIRSLTRQKYRKEHNVFIAEGNKIVREWLMSNTVIRHIVALEEWVQANQSLISRHPAALLSIVDEHQLQAVSALQTANKALVIAEQPADVKSLNAGPALLLDCIQDPGNMGTIIRVADWFGIPNVVFSPDSVDVYNPKVIQAAMGSHLRVALYEREPEAFLAEIQMPVIAATLNGSPLYEMQSFTDAVLMIGNESKGLRETLIRRADYQVTIPKRGGAESLNAAVSTGILCAYLVRG